MKQGQVIITRARVLSVLLTVVFAVIFSIMVCLTVCIAQMRWEINRLSILVEDSDDDIGVLNRRLLKREYPTLVSHYKPMKREKVFAQDFHVKY